MSGAWERWRRWRGQKRAVEDLGLTTYPFCREPTGTKSCCCCDDTCDEAKPDLCWERIPLWRYLLHGACAEHRPRVGSACPSPPRP